MDFTLSLTHFCELHGPTSLMCTQALPTVCSVCNEGTDGESSAPRTQNPLAVTPSPDFATESTMPKSFGSSAKLDGNGERCRSCSLSLPSTSDVGSSGARGTNPGDVRKQTRLRTKETKHVCGATCSGLVHDRPRRTALVCSPGYFQGMAGSFPCHSHHVDYVSSFSPVKPNTFSEVRRATIRTLSGEQLPRGQPCGPLLFGDSKTGYTIAYGFRLADVHARGRQRYYALVALAGSEASHAIAACTILWALFEKIAAHILQAASEVTAQGSMQDASLESGQVIPVSSFLTGRAMDPDGFPRSGAPFRANGIVDLVGNEDFFYELHLAFVTILQELKAPETSSKRHESQLCAGLHHSECAQHPECCLQEPSLRPAQPPDKVGPGGFAASAQRGRRSVSAFDQCSMKQLKVPHHRCEQVAV